MFQVASHPTSFPHHSYRETTSSRRGSSHAVPPPSPSVQLPRNLSRPEFVEVSQRAIRAASSDLANVPPEYIRRGLRAQAKEMLAGLESLAPSHTPKTLPRSHLPSSLTIPLRSPTSSTAPQYPTHALAVSSSKSHDGQAIIVPVHSIVLAANCAKFPEIRTTSHNPQSPTLHLPVVPFTLPSPIAFTILSSYLYQHRLDKVLKALFPMPKGFMPHLTHRDVVEILNSRSTLQELSTYLCQHDEYSLARLTEHAMHVRDVWQDMVTLGLYEPELWDTIDLAWEVILGALNIAASSR